MAYPAVGPDTIVAASRSANPFGTFAFASPVSSRSCGTPNVVPTQLPDVAGTVTKEVPSRTGNPSVTSASASPVSSRNEAPTLRPDVSGTVKTEDPSRTGNTFGTFFFTSPVSSRCCETTNVAATPQQPQEIADSSVIIEEGMDNHEDYCVNEDQSWTSDLNFSFNSQLEDPTWKFQIEADPAVIYNNVARAATPTLDPSVRANPVFQHQPGTSSPINVNAHVIQSVDAPAVAFMWTNPTANPPTGAEWNQPAGPLSPHPQNLESLPQKHADSVEEEMGNGEDHEDVHDQFLSADLDLSFNSQLEDPTWKFQIEAAPAVIYNNVARAATPTLDPSVRANPVFQHQPGTSSPINVNAHVIQSVDAPAVAFMWTNSTANPPTGAEWNQPAGPLSPHPQNLESLPQEHADSVEEEMGNGEDHEDVHDQFLSADLDLSFNSQREDPTWKFQIEAAPAVIYNNVARAATPTLDPSVRANPVFQHQPGTSSPINVNAHVIQSVDAPAVAFMWTNPTANPPTGAEWNQPAGPLSTHPQNLESLPQEHADSVEEEMGNGEDHEDVHDQFLSADLDLSFNSQREDPTWKFQIEAAPAVIYNNVASTANPTIEPSVRANLVFQHQPASGSKSNRFLISPGTEVTQFNFRADEIEFELIVRIDPVAREQMLTNLNAQLSAVAQEVTRLTVEQEELLTAHEAIKSKRDSLTEQVEELTESVAELEEDRDTLREEKCRLEREALEEQCRILLGELTWKNEADKKLEEGVWGLEGKLGAMIQEKLGIGEKVRQLEETNRTLEGALSEKGKVNLNQTQQATVAAKDHEIAQLIEGLDRKVTDFEQVVSEKDEIETQLVKAQNELELLGEERTKLATEFEKLTEEKADVDQRLIQQLQDYDTLNEGFMSERDAKETMIRQMKTMFDEKQSVKSQLTAKEKQLNIVGD
ncbi:hypothetical protein quinque_002458 [Culex quinquefasciatus]